MFSGNAGNHNNSWLWEAGPYRSTEGDMMYLEEERWIQVSYVAGPSHDAQLKHTEHITQSDILVALGSVDSSILAGTLQASSNNGLNDGEGNTGETFVSSGPSYTPIQGIYTNLESGHKVVLLEGHDQWMEVGVYVDFSTGNVLNYSVDNAYYGNILVTLPWSD
jgi:hypothetical protein